MERNGLITVRLLVRRVLLGRQVRQEQLVRPVLRQMLRGRQGQLVQLGQLGLLVRQERHRQLPDLQDLLARQVQLAQVSPIKAQWRMRRRCRGIRQVTVGQLVTLISRQITPICGFGMARLG